MTARPLELTLDRLPTPIGTAMLITDAEGFLRAFDWTDFEPRIMAILTRQYGRVILNEGRAPDQVRRPVEAYFAGDAGALAGIPWKTGGTAFQRDVWTALCDIPSGETISYKTLAERIGRPTAVRAVGLANGSNPVAVVVPCHRVIGADGSLTGYGGGLPRKEWLLKHEGAAFRMAA